MRRSVSLAGVVVALLIAWNIGAQELARTDSNFLDIPTAIQPTSLKDQTPSKRSAANGPGPSTPAVLPVASLGISKVVDQPAISFPTTLNYTIFLTNTGEVPLTNVVVTDILTGGAFYSSGDSNPKNVLDIGETWVYGASYTVTQVLIDAGNSIVNTALVQTSETAQQPGEAVTVINQAPSMSIMKTATLINGSTPNPFEYKSVGDQISYQVVLTNVGNVTLTGVVLTDSLVDVSGVFPVESISGNGKLDVGETWTYYYDYSVAPADLVQEQVDNTATAYSTEASTVDDSETVLAKVVVQLISEDGFESGE